MPPPKGVWGIDIGQCALKALRLEMIDGVPVATAFDYVEHPKILSQPDADPDQLTREALDTFLSRNNLRFDEVAIGIAGQSGLARFVKLPPVEEKKIADIVKFEAKQQIPFPLDEVVWDFQKIAGGDVMDGFAMETEIGLFAMKRDIIARNLMHYTAAKVEVHFVQMSPLALVNYATYEVLKKGGPESTQGTGVEEDDETPAGKKRSLVVLDVGTDASNLIITDGGKIIWQRPIPLGGNNFTKALAKEMKLTFAKAEHLKRNAAKSPDLPSILRALKPVLADFVGEVQRSLGYFTNTHRDAHVAYMIGLGSAFRLPGLQKYLSEKLQLDVRKPGRFERITGDAVLNDPVFTENVLSFPVAYGLALQGIGQARLMTNLLPGEIKFDRLVRSKKPYAVAAAAALLVGTAGLALGYSASYKPLVDAKVDRAIDQSKEAVRKAQNQDSTHKTKVQEVADAQAQVKAIIAGQDEKLNWARLAEVITAALPRPGDNGTLRSDDQPLLWRSQQAVRAYEKFQARMAAGVPIEAINDDDLADHLAMVNVEVVHGRWVESLPEFFTKTDDFVKTMYNRNIADWMKPNEREPDPTRGGESGWKPKPPDGSGWIIEIRGYTYFNTPEVNHGDFLRRSIVRNLQNADYFIENVLKDEGKFNTYLPGVTDPTKGKISNVFAFGYGEPKPGAPRWIDLLATSPLDGLVDGTLKTEAAPTGSASPSTPPGGAAPTVPGSGRWSPGRAAAGATASTTGGTPSTGTPLPITSLGKKIRYDFDIMFVWKEPTPSGTVGIMGTDAAPRAASSDAVDPGRGPASDSEP